MFTLDTESGFPDVVLIEAAYGLGESIVKGRVDPDEFWLFKPTLARGPGAILKRVVGAKPGSSCYGPDGLPHARGRCRRGRGRLSLSDDDAVDAGPLGALAIEDALQPAPGEPTPMDIEWAKDGVDGRAVHPPGPSRDGPRRPQGAGRSSTSPSLDAEGESCDRQGGRPEDRRGAGPRRARASTSCSGFQPGEVLVADMTDPDWEPMMKMAAAIVTNRGGRTCHAAIVSRELGVPCVVGTGNGDRHARATADTVTVSCAEGEVGTVYDGAAALRAPQTLDLAQPAPAAHASHAERRQSRPGVPAGRPAERRRGPGPRWSSSSPADPGPSAGPAPLLTG